MQFHKEVIRRTEVSKKFYFIKLRNISDAVKRIRINSIYLISDGIEKDIIGKQEREFVPSDLSLYDSESYILSYDLSFDYETIERIAIIYTIDIELNNGKIISVEEQADFVKEIIRTLERN